MSACWLCQFQSRDFDESLERATDEGKYTDRRNYARLLETVDSMEEYAYVVNVDGAVVRDDEYLLIERGADEEHASGLLSFPGGKVEQPPGGEATIETTAARELYEEVGVEIGTVEYVLSSTFEADDGTQCINIVTLCEHVDGDAHRRDPDEVAAVHWLSPAEIEAHDHVPEFVEEYIERVEQFRTAKPERE